MRCCLMYFLIDIPFMNYHDVEYKFIMVPRNRTTVDEKNVNMVE